MIISKTPFRISLFGGSTDYPSYYKKHGSLILGFAMDKYCYITLRQTPKIFNYKTLVSYSKLEKVSKNSDVEHNGVRGVLEYLKVRQGVEIHHLCDLPSQTGIGSSSSFIVGLLNAASQLKKKTCDVHCLAETAIEVERVLLGEPGGIQDQIWAAYGGVNSIHINKDGSFEVKPLPLSHRFKHDLLDRCALIYTGKKRKSFDIAKAHDSRKGDSAKKSIHNIANAAYEAFHQEDIELLGRLLDQSWEQKKKISPLISSDHVESMYSDLQKNGMIGGKLLGTGGSGFIFCILKEGKKDSFVKKFAKDHVSFDFDEKGTQIIN